MADQMRRLPALGIHQYLHILGHLLHGQADPERLAAPHTTVVERQTTVARREIIYLWQPAVSVEAAPLDENYRRSVAADGIGQSATSVLNR